jgi:hypothetical protein
MSTTAPPAPITLTQDQADAVLKYAIDNNMAEYANNDINSVEPQARLDDAATLVFQAERSYIQAGNRAQPVIDTITLAGRPMPTENAVVAEPPAAATPAPPATPPILPEAAALPVVAAPSAPAPTNEYSAHTVEQLQAAVNALGAVPASETVTAEINKLNAEISTRSANAPATPPSSVAPPTPTSPLPAAPGASAGQSPVPPAPAGGPAPIPAAVQPVAPVVPAPAPSAPVVDAPPAHSDGLPPVPGMPNSGIVAAPQLPADAVVAATDIPTGPVGAPADRDALLAQLTFPMLMAYGHTMETVAALNDEDLLRMISDPGNAQQPTTPMPDQEPAAAVTSSAPESPERDGLVEKLEGPMLKAWGQGRKSIPQMTDEQIQLIIAHPDGPPEGYDKASFKDDAQVHQILHGDPAVADQALQVAALAAPMAPTASAPSQETPPVEEVPQLDAPVAEVTTPEPPSSPAAPAPASTPPVAPADVPAPTAPVAPSGEIDALIAQERLPIPPDMESAYRLPNDMSKVNDDALRSLHAMAHATEARCNWLINVRDDTKAEYEKLITHRSLEVRNASSIKTKAGKDEEVAADSEVVRYQEELKDWERGTNKLKLFRDNAHRDCERMSRQWSMRYRESSSFGNK